MKTVQDITGYLCEVGQLEKEYEALQHAINAYRKVEA